MDAASDDDRALAALSSRDEDAVRQLVAAWTPGMLRLARAHTMSEAAAEDVVQDAWVTVLSGLDRFERRSTLRTWVLGIVVNVARRAGRRDRRTVPFSATRQGDRNDGSVPAVDPARFESQTGHWASPPLRWDLRPEEQLAAAELRAVIDTALAGLPVRQRAVMTARDLFGLSPTEVGSLYELADGNQRVLLHRARSTVRAAVERYGAISSVHQYQEPTGPSRNRAGHSTALHRLPSPGHSEVMVCQQLVELVTDYLDDALDAGLRDRVEKHLATCDDCNGYVAQVRRMLDITASLAATAPPQFIARLVVALRNVITQDLTV